MKNIETSYLKKENKKACKIKFEKFPGDSNKKLNKILVKKTQKVLLFTAIILVFIILLIGSSFLNKKILDGNTQSYYKLINKFSGKYANIKPSDRSILFKDIGFDVSKEEIRNLNGKDYNATYAYRKFNDINGIYDTICVYYDEENSVYYITVNLVYETSFLTSANIIRDVNNLLNNFMKINVSNDALLKLNSDNYYYDDSLGIKLSIYLNDFSKEGYSVVNIIVQR